MKIFEFDVPMLIMPKEPYWLNKQKIVITPTGIPLPERVYWGPTTATKIIVYDTDPQNLTQIITDLIVFSNFLNKNDEFMQWIFNKAFTKHERYEREIEELKDYVNEVFSKAEVKHDGYYTVNFHKYPLRELTPEPTRVDFGECFEKYIRLSTANENEMKIKRLIEFFSFSSLSEMIMYRIYNNTNLQISNCFIMIEALINIDIKDQSGYKLCQHCSKEIPTKRSIMDLVAEYVESKIEDKEICGLVLEILSKHYNVRNRFLHNASYEGLEEKIDRIKKKIGSSSILLSDEIKHGDAANMGLFAIVSFLRIDLLDRLS